MKLKCFGGPRGGQFWDVETDRSRVGEMVRVPLDPPPISAIPFSIHPSVITQEVAYYMIDSVRTRDREWKFLRSELLLLEELLTEIFS